MEPIIRQARPEDAQTVHDFICELARYEREPDAVTYDPQRLHAQMSRPSPPFECLLAEADGEPVGFALYFFTYSTWEGAETLYLEDFFVPERCRRGGVGTALFEALAREAHRRGCQRMEWAVLRWNQMAITFYEKLGAERQDAFVGYRLTGEALKALADGDHS
ncbi:MAG: GNAT family N-acetyltransferase [Myxococcota bacterium]|jgi:GNAT superfamily N-acetyltransferase|nr:GNAT family N-acetyltransferase [Myxococcota bacterium]